MCLIIVLFPTKKISVEFITAYLREDHVIDVLARSDIYDRKGI